MAALDSSFSFEHTPAVAVTFLVVDSEKDKEREGVRRTVCGGGNSGRRGRECLLRPSSPPSIVRCIASTCMSDA